MSAFTPGPWRAVLDRPGKRCPHPMALVATTCALSRTAAIDCTNSGATYAHDCANAVLIAAAPDLLAALEALIPMVEEFAVNPELDNARAVCAKARGES